MRSFMFLPVTFSLVSPGLIMNSLFFSKSSALLRLVEHKHSSDYVQGAHTPRDMCAGNKNPKETRTSVTPVLLALYLKYCYREVIATALNLKQYCMCCYM